jgi:hypothetical protein
VKALSISVMAHPSREKFFPHIRRRLGDIPFHVDDDSEGPYPCARKAWALYDPSADYHLVLQDDALVCRKFRQRLQPYLEDLEDRAMQLYLGQGRESRFQPAINAGRRYIDSPNLWWGVAIVLPTHRVQKMLDFCEIHEMQDSIRGWGNRRSDSRIGRYIRRKKIWVRYPLPCLVGHRDPPSIAKKKKGGKGLREAFYFIDREKDK